MRHGRPRRTASMDRSALLLAVIFIGILLGFNGSGSPIEWRWADGSLVVANGASDAFTLRYRLDAVRLAQGGSAGGTGQKFAIFRRDVLFFVPGDVFPLV